MELTDDTQGNIKTEGDSAVTQKKMVEWLKGELPVWQEKGLLDASAADRLRQYYAAEEKENSLPIALIVCGVLGAALIGLGIILLVAHNWDGMTRPERALAAYLPLLAGIGLTGWSIWKRPDSAAWCESSSVFLMASVGACIALVSQTYHIQSDLAGFLLVWMVLTGPLAYLARSRVVGALYWVGLLFFASFTNHRTEMDAMLYWPLMAAMLPLLWMEHRKNPGGPWELFLSWVLAITLSITPTILLSGVFRNGWILTYSSIFAIFYVAARWQNREGGFWQEPFRVISTAGTVILAIVFSFKDCWRNIRWYPEDYPAYHWMFTVQDYTLTFGLTAVALILVVVNVIRKRFDLLAFGTLPVLAVIGFVLAGDPQAPVLIPLLFNAYVLVLALWVIMRGIQQRQLSRMNGGLAILTLLIFTRFLDSNLSIVLRGIVFILLGIGFLITNVVMLGRKEAVK